MLLDYAVSALITLFVVVDPIAMAPTFLVVTDGMPRASRRSVGVRASMLAGAILTGTALIGDRLLNILEISLPAFRIAGGLLLFWIAAEMVFGVRSRHEGEAAEQAMEERVRNVAAFPLAIPLLAGPGAMAENERDVGARQVGALLRRIDEHADRLGRLDLEDKSIRHPCLTTDCAPACRSPPRR